jgi:hypothetical protein
MKMHVNTRHPHGSIDDDLELGGPCIRCDFRVQREEVATVNTQHVPAPSTVNNVCDRAFQNYTIHNSYFDLAMNLPASQ